MFKSLCIDGKREMPSVAGGFRVWGGSTAPTVQRILRLFFQN